jgi:hypothetical protein
MPRFEVAHLHEQGQDVIIIPLENSFGHKSDDEQREIILELQMQANSAGLAGTVIPVWESGGSMSFIAPPPWHPFFQSMSIHDVAMNINREIYW